MIEPGNSTAGAVGESDSGAVDLAVAALAALGMALGESGDVGLRERTDRELQEILQLPRDPRKLRDDIVSMRRRLLKEKSSASVWDLKLAEGGLTDIDFIAQFLCSRYCIDI